MQAIAVTNLTTTPIPLACIPSGGATTHRPSHSVTAVANRPPPTSPHQQITHSMPPEKVELFKSLEPWASKNVLPLLKPVETCWQPNDFLPDSTKPVNDFVDEVRALRDRAKGLSDEYLVVLVGDMISEDAVPTYQTMFNITDAIRDETASSPSPWATLTRAWTAEENRHGDLLRTYLYLSGRVDMSMVERTVQYLIGAGMDPGLENNPYLVYVYTSFQERVAFISHRNKARLAKEGGDPILANICGTIADDESHHENAFIKIIEKLLEVDANETMLAIGKMLRKKIRMPAHLMYDGRDPHLFEHFGLLAHKIGVYTSNDYVDILEYLIGRWRLEKVKGLTGDARREQEFVCSLAPGIRKVHAKEDERAKEGLQRMKISWIFNREVII